LSNASGKFNWCAYGSDYPPNAKDNSSGGYDLRGSQPFIINGTTEVNATTYSGSVITALTDATGCPGVWCGRDGETAGLLDCCATGTTNCSGTCKANSNYTTNDGSCSGSCYRAYTQLRNVCGVVTNASYSTYSKLSCSSGCSRDCSSCATFCTLKGYTYADYINQDGAIRCRCSNGTCPSSNSSGYFGAFSDFTWSTNAWGNEVSGNGTWVCSYHTDCN
jgi:hypothetical protein